MTNSIKAEAPPLPDEIKLATLQRITRLADMLVKDSIALRHEFAPRVEGSRVVIDPNLVFAKTTSVRMQQTAAELTSAIQEYR